MKLTQLSVMALSAVAGSALEFSRSMSVALPDEPVAASAQPGSQPRPANSQPRPANSQPSPANPQPDPANSQPRQTPPPTQPTPSNLPTTPPGTAQPGTAQPGTAQPGNLPVVIDPRTGQPITVLPVPSGSGTVYERPFAFQSPHVEARFNESANRLVALETRMNQSNLALLKRLGEIRTLSPEKQNAGLIDLIQQVLLEQGQLQKYLVQARTTWSGEFQIPPIMETPTETAPGLPVTEAPQNAPR